MKGKFTLLLIFLGTLINSTSAFAQTAPNKANAATGNDLMTQTLDFSRPGTNHAVLDQIAGNWNFQDAKLSFVKGTLVRKPMYEGRFYSVEVTGGKLPLPVADGKMKLDNYRSMQIEGYDNPRKVYTTISLNNHIGSDIQYQTGLYEPAKKEFTYTWEDELVPGAKKQNRRVLKIVDANHYTEEYFELQNGNYAKVRELDYTRSAN